jgi:hypothetical protein
MNRQRPTAAFTPYDLSREVHTSLIILPYCSRTKTELWALGYFSPKREAST